MKRWKIIILLLFFLILVLIIWYDSLNFELSTSGSEFSGIQMQINELKKENSVLGEKILDAESFRVISEKALRAGYVPAVYHFLKIKIAPSKF